MSHREKAPWEDPGHAGETMSLGWPGNAFGIPPEELEEVSGRQLLSCIRGGNCPGPNVSSLQLPGDVNFFANQLAVPTMEFAFEQTKAEELPDFNPTEQLWEILE
ncbi:hypothetical protein L3Q82_007841 [Scortum barcoo]|uniref:Uncharacterized protein n=1 Tax=Scortum barcoo TaxID=214431 RepID=A0ACB8WK34_9TELE|nr:hypothetical protein L3Q82_007841 [Scortum barcoo]